MKMRIFVLVGSAYVMCACSSAKKDVTAQPVQTPAPAAKAEATKVAATAAAATAAAKGEVSCARDKDVRSFVIESASPKGCELLYTKHGNKEKIAWSEFGSTHCENVRDRVRTNLETAGFTCGDGQKSGPQPASVPAAPAKTTAKSN